MDCIVVVVAAAVVVVIAMNGRVNPYCDCNEHHYS